MCHLVFLSAQFNFPVVFIGLQIAKLAVKVFHIGLQLVCKKYPFFRIIIFDKGLFKSSHILQSCLLIKITFRRQKIQENKENKKFLFNKWSTILQFFNRGEVKDTTHFRLRCPSWGEAVWSSSSSPLPRPFGFPRPSSPRLLFAWSVATSANLEIN